METRLRLDAADARFLESALGRLPGAEAINRPVTVNLNGEVAVWASSAEHPERVTELVLRRSAYSGVPVSVCANRALLERALRMGFTEVGFTGTETPFVCRDDRRTYAVQPLSEASPLPAGAEVTRIESGAADGGERRAPVAPEEARMTMTVPESSRNGHEPASSAVTSNRPSARPVNTPSTTGPEPPGASLTALLQDAEALHAALADAQIPHGAADRRAAAAAQAVAAGQRDPEVAPPAQAGRDRRLIPLDSRSLPASPLRPIVHPRGGIDVPLRLNVGVSRKVGLPQYGSVGASCNVEVEVDSGLIDRDLDAFHARVRDVYVAAHQAVHDELARLQAPVESLHEPTAPAPLPVSNGRPTGNGHHEGPPVSRSRPRRPATENQLRAIRSIAARQHADLGGLLGDYGVERPEDLSLKQASELIDAMKSPASI